MINKRVDALLLLILLLIAVSLRLFNFSNGYGFYGDQGEDLLAVNKWLKTGDPPLVGIKTSVGDFHMGPLYYYLITPFVILFGGQAVSPAILFLISGIALVIITFLFFRKYFDRESAFITGVLLALSPHLIFLSKGAYSPNLAPFLSLINLFSLYIYITKKNYWFVLIAYFSIGVGLQMHYTFLANVIITSLIVLIFKYKSYLDYKFYIYSIAGFLIPLIPFIWGQFILDFADFRNLYEYLLLEKERVVSLSIFLEKLIFPFSIYYSGENLPWVVSLFLKPIYFFVLIIFSVLAFTKNKYSDFAKLTLVFYTLAVFISVNSGLNYWWWYHGYFSVLVILMVGIISSYLYHYAKIKYLWIVFAGVFLLWNFLGIQQVYAVMRSPDVPKKTAQVIIEDIKMQEAKNNRIGLATFDLISNDMAFEQRYFLEKEGITTFSTKDLNLANYLIVENKSAESREIVNLEDSIKLIKLKKLDFDKNSQKVRSADVYRIERM